MKDLSDLIRSSSKAVFCHIGNVDDPLRGDISFLGKDFSTFGMEGIGCIADLLSHIDDRSESAQGIGVKKFHKIAESYFLLNKRKGNERTILLPLISSSGRIDVLANLFFDNDGLSILFLLLKYGDGLPDFETYIQDSYKDRLTGLFNFQTLREHMKAKHSDGYLCLFDLNKFKEINDNFGHQAGDDVLIELSKYLIKNSTPNESFYRRSGDEFFILFFNHDEKAVRKVIANIDSHLKSLGENKLKRYHGLECSASFGVVDLMYTEENPIELEDYLKLADLAMYQAKTSKKQSHWISFEDAKNILLSGTLDNRLKDVLNKARR